LSKSRISSAHLCAARRQSGTAQEEKGGDRGAQALGFAQCQLPSAALAPPWLTGRATGQEVAGQPLTDAEPCRAVQLTGKDLAPKSTEPGVRLGTIVRRGERGGKEDFCFGKGIAAPFALCR